MLRLKVCGLRDNIEEVAALEPDYVGFIFYNKSPRYVGEDFVMPEISSSVEKIGVFVNETLDEVQKIVKKYKLDFAQVHGDESPDYCYELKRKGIGVIKAFQMNEEFDFIRLKKYDAVSDFFLFDTKAKSFGGSGKTFNWDLLNRYSMGKEYFLSGGISLDNVQGIAQIDLSKVHALDVNSRFEIRPGLKDALLLNKLKRIMVTIRSS